LGANAAALLVVCGSELRFGRKIDSMLVQLFAKSLVVALGGLELRQEKSL